MGGRISEHAEDYVDLEHPAIKLLLRTQKLDPWTTDVRTTTKLVKAVAKMCRVCGKREEDIGYKLRRCPKCLATGRDTFYCSR